MVQKGRINEASIGRKLGVNRSTVNRYVKKCETDGILLTDQNCFSDIGDQLLAYYKDLENKLYAYFEGIGIEEEKRAGSVEAMFDDMDLETLGIICEKEKKHLNYENIDEDKGGEIEYIPFADLELHLRKGAFPVEFSIYRQGSNWQVISMAENGFKHPALLYFGEDDAYLELAICEMKQYSRKQKDLLLSGHLSSVKCRDSRDELLSLPIKSGKVRIPLCHFYFEKFAQDEMMGQIQLVMTCSVGEVHMPESVATLIVKL